MVHDSGKKMVVMAGNSDWFIVVHGWSARFWIANGIYHGTNLIHWWNLDIPERYFKQTAHESEKLEMLLVFDEAQTGVVLDIPSLSKNIGLRPDPCSVITTLETVRTAQEYYSHGSLHI